ncbi:MAG: cytidine deaminase [Eubacteriales bacterium]
MTRERGKMMTERESEIYNLVKRAIEAMEQQSYAPYSHFQVGAALLTKSGKIYTGGNIENAAYTPTNCAERTAFFKAVSEGEREFKSIAVVGGAEGVLTSFTAPCGVCRQVMMEFCNPDEFTIILANSIYEQRIYTLKELLPAGFGPLDLK